MSYLLRSDSKAYAWQNYNNDDSLIIYFVSSIVLRLSVDEFILSSQLPGETDSIINPHFTQAKTELSS